MTCAQCLLFLRLRSWWYHPYFFELLCFAEATSCSFVQRPQKPGRKPKCVSKDRNMASLEGIPCLIPATAGSHPGSMEGQANEVPQLCSAPWALSAWRFSTDKFDKGADFPYKLLILCPVCTANIVLQTVSVSLQEQL